MCIRDRVTNHAGGTTSNGNGAVPSELEAPQGAQHEEVAHVQAWRRWVEAAVHRRRSFAQASEEILVGLLVDESTLLEIAEEVGRHSPSLRESLLAEAWH